MPDSPETEVQPAVAAMPAGGMAGNEPAARPLPPDPDEHFSWHASEYVHHHKGPAWYLGLAGIIMVLLVISALFQQWLSMGVFLAMGAAIVVYAQRPPRVLEYELTATGINIDGRFHAYTQFRSFGVLSDIEWHVIDLEPTQRFMPRLSLLFDDQSHDQIVQHLAGHLPRSDREPDMIERLTRYLRF